MKVILWQDLKGKGKIYDTIDVANGYGNDLIRKGIAKADTPENRAEVLKIIANDIETKRIKRLAAQDMAGKIENAFKNFMYVDKLTPNGTLANGFSKTMMQAELAKYNFTNVKVKPFAVIKTVGLHDISLNILNEIDITIQLHVESK